MRSISGAFEGSLEGTNLPPPANLWHKEFCHGLFVERCLQRGRSAAPWPVLGNRTMSAFTCTMVDDRDSVLTGVVSCARSFGCYTIGHRWFLLLATANLSSAILPTEHLDVIEVIERQSLTRGAEENHLLCVPRTVHKAPINQIWRQWKSTVATPRAPQPLCCKVTSPKTTTSSDLNKFGGWIVEKTFFMHGRILS